MANHPASTTESFIGRTRELGQIQAACSSTRTQGRGNLVVVSGEPGIGKTRFGAEIADHAASEGLQVVTARCWVNGGAPPLWPWQPILRELCGSDASDLLEADPGRMAIDPDRFLRFAAITDRLAAACAQQPVCLLIDDVHAADAGTLLLIRFVARSLLRLPVTLVLTRRSNEPTPGTAEADLLAEVESEATPVVLPRFNLGETTTFLAGYGLGDLDPDLVNALLGVTRGNPLFLRRVAALGRPDSGQALPSGLQMAITQALTRLSGPAQRVLRLAAVLGTSPSVTEAAAVSTTDAVTVLAALEDAAAAGLVTLDGPDRFSFSHEMVRSALEDGLAVDDHLDAHARAARVVAPDGAAVTSDRLARRAHHALAAAPRSVNDASLAVATCQEAARSMVRSFAYEQADRLLSAAVALHEPSNLGPPPAQLLVAWAQAALMCGHMTEARQRFDSAATTARHEGDPVLSAEAALGLGGHRVVEHRDPVERARVLGLQRSALAALPPGHEPLRCRLAARLATEAVFDVGPIEPVEAAIVAARDCGDPIALAEALSLASHALLRPEHIRTRLPMADELVRVASEVGDGMLAVMGLFWRTIDLFHLGDPRAARALEDMRERATAQASQNILYFVAVMDVMQLIRRGRLHEAEHAASRAYSVGARVGDVDIVSYVGAHILGLRWIQGREAEVLETAEQMATSPALTEMEFSFRAAAALFSARADHHDQARAALDRLASRGLAALPKSGTWMTGMMCIVEAASELGDAALAREAHGLLLPYADLPIMTSLAVLCLGSTERTLGTAARVFGDHDRAIEHLERAVTANRRLGNRPLTAIAQADLATALRGRDRPSDPARAAELLGRAIPEAEAMGMTGRLATWRGQLEGLKMRQPSARSATAGGSARSPGANGNGRSIATPVHGVIHQEGRMWIVALDDRQVWIGDLVGLCYLRELLTHPGQSIPALTLASRGSVAGHASQQELLDDEARARYAARAQELSRDLAEAEANNDIVRTERLRDEIDALVDQLESAAGLNGRSRTFTTPTERARTAVRKAIKRAIDAIDEADPAIAEVLRASIVTGSVCTYIPQSRRAVSWSTGPVPESV